MKTSNQQECHRCKGPVPIPPDRCLEEGCPNRRQTVTLADMRVEEFDLMVCSNCYQTFEWEDDVQSRYHEGACVVVDVLSRAEIARRLRSHTDDGWERRDGWVTAEQTRPDRRIVFTEDRAWDTDIPAVIYIGSHTDRETSVWEKRVQYRRQVECPCGYMAWEYRHTQGYTACTKCGGKEIVSPVHPKEE